MVVHTVVQVRLHREGLIQELLKEILLRTLTQDHCFTWKQHNIDVCEYEYRITAYMLYSYPEVYRPKNDKNGFNGLPCLFIY